MDDAKEEGGEEDAEEAEEVDDEVNRTISGSDDVALLPFVLDWSILPSPFLDCPLCEDPFVPDSELLL